MYTSNRDNHSRGSFGAKTPWKKGFRDRNFDKPSFKATCAECGSQCTVPFRPNGSKPVLCSNCFGNSGGSKPFGRSNFADRGPRERTYSAPGASRAGGADVEEQLKAINSKLDRIILSLEALELE
jgi:CxxC-x17-CxxC domain-containing protein